VEAGETGNGAPDALVPIDTPPLGTKNQLIVPPPDIGPEKFVIVTEAAPKILSTVYI